ncbi:iron-containing alcohol dehydrogenase [Pseudorhodoferax sp.]|uniref:iron-containing alcohol dehydrogenase n=1 Tax=Pseudorhodoferax sp. TaxID=1993553 RepID=UPI0039E351E1
MLSAVLRWNAPVNAVQQAEVSAAVGEPGMDASEALRQLIEFLGMPRSLSAIGIRQDQFPAIAEQAMGTAWVPCNPRRISGPSEIEQILKLAA